MNSDTIASPCINVCYMQRGSEICAGCFRSLDEIARWSRASDAEKRQILAAVARRREEQAPV